MAAQPAAAELDTFGRRPSCVVVRRSMMKIVCVGGGPSGLFFAVAAKLRKPRHHISVFERRTEGTTYGQGIVYWDDLLHCVRRVDLEIARAISAASIQWK